MNNQYEPMRLADNPEAPADLRRLLARAHDDIPSLAQRELLVKAALGQAAAPPNAWGRASGARWATRAARVAVKTLSVAAVVGVGAGAVYTAVVRLRPARPAADPIEAPVAADVAPVVEPLPDGPGLEPAGTAAGAVGASPKLPLHAAPTARAWTRSHALREARATSAAIGSGANAAATNVPAGAATNVASSPVERRQAGADARSAAPPAAAPEARPDPAEPEAPRRPVLLPGEAVLLRSAREALATSPARTLSLTNEHLRRYPHGMLNQEREALAIEALIALGSTKEARQRAWAFELEYPDSPHRGRIRQALARAAGAAPSP
ncbi:MAG TPA: hypothetical protein VHO67_13220 [Polyangia bacterium]|nr:hypothetical protein [Polyangia bacterium]